MIAPALLDVALGLGDRRVSLPVWLKLQEELAQDPPDLLIQMSREVATFYEFWRANELVDEGRAVAEKALDAAGL